MQPTPRPPFFFPIQLVSGYFSSLGTVRFLPSGPMATYVKYASDVSMRSFVPPAPSGSISAVMRIFIEVFPTLSRSAVSTTTSFGIARLYKRKMVHADRYNLAAAVPFRADRARNIHPGHDLAPEQPTGSVCRRQKDNFRHYGVGISGFFTVHRTISSHEILVIIIKMDSACQAGVRRRMHK